MTDSAEVHASLRAVTKVFPATSGMQPVSALGPLDLEIRRGEFLAIVGPSGCGKSTLLDIVAGLSRPTAGQAEFEGTAIGDDASFPWLTVLDNVAFGLRRQGVEKQEVDERVRQSLQFMGLTDFAQAHPPQLSGGMRQRVCIARTLVLKPRLILLDEPFGALDQQTRLLMGDELLRLWRATEATVVLITHAIDEACMLADRVGIMTARPGRFADMITTGWERDRDSRIVSDDRFGKLTGRVWAILREESLRSMGQSESSFGGTKR